MTSLPHPFEEFAARDLGAAPASVLPLLNKLPWDVSDFTETVAFATRSLEVTLPFEWRTQRTRRGGAVL